MKQIIRFNLFETNSSSTHCLVLISKDEFNKFKRSELVMEVDSANLVTPEDFMARRGDEYESIDDAMEYDYPALVNPGSVKSADCFDKDGKPQVAVSFYIAG